MATDQKTTDILTEPAVVSAIENELPTYRAISTQAVFSIVCGILALLSVANSYFFLFAILAVVLGVLADRKIQRYPDVLTGRGLAKAGVAMGLIFGLGIFTYSTVQGVIHSHKARDFAKYYADVIKTKGMAELLWLQLPPSQRKSVSPAEALEKWQGSKRQEQAMLEIKITDLRNLKKRLDSSQDQEIRFVKLENEGSEGLTLYAQALYEVHGPATKNFPEKEYALVTFKGIVEEGQKGYGWLEEGVAYPYKPGTGSLPEKPVDDGHGHGHAH
ncbi:MAG: DUF4190 domain-containing protein [Isosphaeraceae bacterium]